MIKHIIPLFLVLPMMASDYQFNKDWSKTDTALETSFILLCAADCLQTLSLEHAGKGGNSTYTRESWKYYYETNPILGKHPSQQEIYTYFAATVLTHVLIAKALPPKYRRIFEAVSIGVEATQVQRNYNIGIKVKF